MMRVGAAVVVWIARGALGFEKWERIMMLMLMLLEYLQRNHFYPLLSTSKRLLIDVYSYFSFTWEIKTNACNWLAPLTNGTKPVFRRHVCMFCGKGLSFLMMPCSKIFPDLNKLWTLLYNGPKSPREQHKYSLRKLLKKKQNYIIYGIFSIEVARR